jgi:hypothetical protein
MMPVPDVMDADDQGLIFSEETIQIHAVLAELLIFDDRSSEIFRKSWKEE